MNKTAPKTVDDTTKNRRTIMVLGIISTLLTIIVISITASRLIPDLQQINDCKNGILSEESCKYAGLISYIFAPGEIAALIFFIIVLAITINKRRSLSKSGQIDSASNVAFLTTVIACAIVILFILGVAVYWLLTWGK